jgi:hypothetical protein
VTKDISTNKKMKTMKKTYINPAVTVFNIQTSQSLLQTVSANGAEVKTGGASTNYEVLSRRSGWWDEDED